MALFQKSVIQKYLNNLDDSIIQDAFKRFQNFYGDKERIENIKLLKEENYQEGFFREIFVDVLGYTINPDKNYNLTTEFKNLTDSGKADGAILLDGKAIGVIELKSTKTTDLESIKKQAFNYKNNQPGCRYVITSNFEKLRFYLDNATEYEEFNLFNLPVERFTILYLILSKESIFSSLPVKLKDESRLHEESVSDKLYKDYSSFKQNVFNNLAKNNPQHDKLFLFHKSQKLLDRLLFVLFAEDRGLIPPNAISKIIDQWKKFAELDEPVSLYSRFVKLFHHLDEGHKYPNYELPAYNGGLFRKDEILDKLIIDDDILHKDTLKLSSYDFNTEIDVNILGHIFEHSINEIEELTAELEGKEATRNKSKKKKEGIFYTPKFITKYIVENTVGALCEEKKKELKIDEIEREIIKNSRTAKGKLTKKAEELLQCLDHYRNYLMSLKILDPACGSGAFLNQALEFLINEHEMIDSYRKELEQDALGLYDISKSILENNLYGVDINEEAVEIAKLSLWLRTAEKGRKLSDLSTNIKCGNSLIDDPEVAGDKAFKWEEEFSEIMANGGFDVVIGNPPYGAKILRSDLNYLLLKLRNRGISSIFSDTYVAFYIKSLQELLKKAGLLGFITPNTWRLVLSGNEFRDFLAKGVYSFQKIIQHQEKIFPDATVDCDTVILKKQKLPNNNIRVEITKKFNTIFSHLLSQKTLAKQDYFNLFLTEKIYTIKQIIEKKSVFVKDYVIIKNGVKPYEKGKGKPPQTEETMRVKPFTSEVKIDHGFSPLIGGSSFHRYKLFWNNDYWIKYGKWLAAPRDKKIFTAPEKLIFRQTGDSITGTFVDDKFIMRDNTHILLPQGDEFNLKFILSILNSKTSNFIYWTNNPEKGEALAQVKLFHLGLLCFPKISKDAQKPFIEEANLMLELNKQLQEKSDAFISRLETNFPIEKLSNKLKEFYKYDFKTFLTELKKKKITLTLKQQDEWEPYFNEYKDGINLLKEEINKTDNEIDQMVYQLYGLTDEEIKIVEESIN